MLQQTQVERVIPKYENFIQTFPTSYALANAKVHDVLTLWQGLGYNRRALYLMKTTQAIEKEYEGNFPQTEVELRQLPGVGSYTAAAICAFAFSKPVVMIETNIRRACIDEFFKKKEGISDSDILPIVASCLDKDNPREWYYALMDYGAHLKKTGENANRRSKHYTRQSKFSGSDREIRGEIVKRQLRDGKVNLSEVAELLHTSEERIQNIACIVSQELLTINTF